jgi:hypothetical protein
MIAPDASCHQGSHEDRTRSKPQEMQNNSMNCEVLPNLSCAISKSNTAVKRVRFSDESEVVVLVPNRRDLSETEIHARWFGKPEYRDLIWESSVTLAILKCEDKKHLVDDGLLCGRGLIDRDKLKTRQRERSYIKSLVLFQLRENKVITDQETVSRLYCECTVSTIRRAREEALQDEKDVKRYMQQPISRNNLGLRISQSENRAAIEDLIMNKLEPENQNPEDLNLMKALRRLTKRKRIDQEAKKRFKEIRLLQKLQKIAKVYNEGNLSPLEKAAVEQAAEALIRDAQMDQYNAYLDQSVPLKQSTSGMMPLQVPSKPDRASLVAQADTETLIQEVMIYKMHENQGNIFRNHTISTIPLCQERQDFDRSNTGSSVEELLFLQLAQDHQSKRNRIM